VGAALHDRESGEVDAGTAKCDGIFGVGGRGGGIGGGEESDGEGKLG